MPAPPPLSEPAMVKATGNFFRAIISKNYRKGAERQRRKEIYPQIAPINADSFICENM